MGHVARSLALYKEFNAREADFVTAIEGVALPARLGLLGTAKKILYRSDKWRSDRKETFYIHPYESAVQCYVPWRKGLAATEVRAWPRELVQLGHCVDLEIERKAGDTIYFTPPEGTLLCATPDGRSLVLLNPGSGVLGALTGGRQRITDRGIDDE